MPRCGGNARDTLKKIMHFGSCGNIWLRR